MYDRLPEEEQYEVEKAWQDKQYKLMDLFCQVTTYLKGLEPKPFYVIGVNGKKRIFNYKKVKNKEEAYKYIREKGFTQYLFAEYVFNSFETIEETGD